MAANTGPNGGSMVLWRPRYDRLDPLPREPLPKTILGGPDALRDAAYIAALVRPWRYW